jgi:hypothetical protein
MTASVPRARLWETQRTARRLVKQGQRPILTRDLARIVGKITNYGHESGHSGRTSVLAVRSAGPQQHRAPNRLYGQDLPHRPRRGGLTLVSGKRPLGPERSTDCSRDPPPAGQRAERCRHRDSRMGGNPDDGGATHACDAGFFHDSRARFVHQRARTTWMLAHHSRTPSCGFAQDKMERRAP